MARSGYGVPEDIQFLDWSESVTSQTRDEVVGLIEEHLSLEATHWNNPHRPGELPGHDPMTQLPLETPKRVKCILGGLSEGHTAIWQKGKISCIVGTGSWVCPEELKSREKCILVKTSIYLQDRTIYDIQVYISEKIDQFLLWRRALEPT